MLPSIGRILQLHNLTQIIICVQFSIYIEAELKLNFFKYYLKTNKGFIKINCKTNR